jgi:hypothetical protein
MYRYLFFIPLIWYVIQARNTIEDFSPLKIGNIWEYSAFDMEGGNGKKINDVFHIENSTIRIEVKSSSVRELDTIFYIQSTKQGTRNQYQLTDTETVDVNEIYFDSVVVTDSTISKGDGYQCPVFPFFNRHAINTTDSCFYWGKEVFGADTVVWVTFSTSGACYYQNMNDWRISAKYLENVGFWTSKYAGSSNTTRWDIHFLLLSFNGKNFTAATSAVNRAPSFIYPKEASSGIRDYVFKIDFENRRSVFPQKGFLLNGKYTGTKNHIGTMPIVIKRPIRDD